MSPLRAISILSLALALSPLGGADGLEGTTGAAGLAIMEVRDDQGLLTCRASALVTVALAWGEIEEAEDAPGGVYSSHSPCGDFSYLISPYYDCSGAPGEVVSCEETAPFRFFQLDPDGTFLYLRVNQGEHFRIEGRLTRWDH